jgi:hypothetical protein
MVSLCYFSHPSYYCQSRSCRRDSQFFLVYHLLPISCYQPYYSLSSIRSSQMSPSSSCTLVIPFPTRINDVGSRMLVFGVPSLGHRYPTVIFTECARRTIANFPNPSFSLPLMISPSCPGSGCSRDANLVQGSSCCQLSTVIGSTTNSSSSETSTLTAFYAFLHYFSLLCFGEHSAVSAICSLSSMCGVAGAWPSP